MEILLIEIGLFLSAHITTVKSVNKQWLFWTWIETWTRRSVNELPYISAIAFF